MVDARDGELCGDEAAMLLVVDLIFFSLSIKPIKEFLQRGSSNLQRYTTHNTTLLLYVPSST